MRRYTIEGKVGQVWKAKDSDGDTMYLKVTGVNTSTTISQFEYFFRWLVGKRARVIE